MSTDTKDTSQPINIKDYFMANVILASKCSKDSEIQSGAVIVMDEKHIVAIGYNEPESSNDYKNDKLLFKVHAIANALMNANCQQLKNAHLYTSRFPCNECVKLIVETDIKKIYYLMSENDYKNNDNQASLSMLSKANIAYEEYKFKLNINLNNK